MSANTYSSQNFGASFNRLRLQRGLAFGVIILGALIAFELFNYSSTEYALTDLLGNLSFLGVPWATILAIAFCGIDFAGIARLHTPEEGNGQSSETWYLFGAWLLAGTMNAMLTWWGVSLAIVNHSTLGSVLIEQTTLLRVVPIFVAVLVWLIRVLIIGTYSLAGTRLLSQQDISTGRNKQERGSDKSFRPASSRSLGISSTNPSTSSAFKSSSRSAQNSTYNNGYTRQEPAYTPLQAGASKGSNLSQSPERTNQPITRK